MEFKKNDENYIYNVIGKNIKKYRKLKKLTQKELAEIINYSLSFVSSIESKKYQSFSLGALYRISLALDVEMYKLCIDEDKKENKPMYFKFKCNKCDYETDIPYSIIEALLKFNSNTINFDCKMCDGKIFPISSINQD